MEKDDLNDRSELSALDPFADPAAREHFVARVLERSALELARRRRAAAEPGWNGGSVFGVMAGWARPALAAAALALVACGLALRAARPHAEEAQSGLLEAMALPSPVEQWLSEDRTPTKADLILTIEGGTAW